MTRHSEEMMEEGSGTAAAHQDPPHCGGTFSPVSSTQHSHRRRAVAAGAVVVATALCAAAVLHGGGGGVSGGGSSLSERFAYEDLAGIPGDPREVYDSANGHSTGSLGLYSGAHAMRAPAFYRVARRVQQGTLTPIGSSQQLPLVSVAAPPASHQIYWGGRDEVPYVQMPPPTISTPGGHTAWVPNRCGDTDRPCATRWVWTDERPHRPLLTTMFPVGEYVPTRRYPFIRGPFKHYRVGTDGNLNEGSSFANRGGRWVWVRSQDGVEDAQQAAAVAAGTAEPAPKQEDVPGYPQAG